ncbi:DgyrCDS3887 [Dimorphilus gyrociliatus]|uniref:Eukaryotic translation initiation factor 3 subunit C n=1 Tax=Dimorphilus gyrociliatus TaxID=2664684 RepID=A0A7I8VHF2_9ANNE|nr:DgyrCDS3887 [Dimorphilus gyrociliatus]
MSKFFAASESDSETSGDEISADPRSRIQPVQYQWSESDDEEKRVVRSAKDKRYEELRDVIKQISNHKKIKDMTKVLSTFEDLSRVFEKSKKVIEREGLPIPRFFLKCLTETEDFINKVWEDKDGRKALSKNNTKSLTALRQKFRKYIKSNFEEEITKYRENPDGEDAVEEEVEAVVEEAPEVVKEIVPEVLKDDEDSESDWSMSSTDESSESNDEGFSLDYFRKKDDDAKTKKTEKRKSKPKDIRISRHSGEEDWTEVTSIERPKLFAKDAEINVEAIQKKMVEHIASRGKKGTDRYFMIEVLGELKTIAFAHDLGDPIQIKLLFAILPAIFDYNPNMATCMKTEIWEMCLSCMIELMELLEKNPAITIGENIQEDSEVLEGEDIHVRGSILSLVERVDEEFIKMLQSVDAHSTDYIERLRDERKIYDLIVRTEKYLAERNTSDEENCRIFLKRIEHVHYKFDARVIDDPENLDDEENSIKIMDRLCKFIYTKDVTDRIRTRAILCQIYHYAIHDQWFEARDLMLMSHLQDTIAHSDVPTQILYNRAMVQLGLCAFRQGHIKDAHNCLVDMQSGGRSKELLAQGLLMQRAHERTAEQEKVEKRRQIPYHRHINLELLECVYLISAMLLEVPYLAAHELDARRRMISKNFHHVLRLSEKQAVVGPPETMREHIVAASKAMKIGDWVACKSFLINDKMQQKVWSLMHNSSSVKSMLERKIQEESLRTYLFSYAQVYNSLSLEFVCEEFELPSSVVHSIISKMIINEELMASLDEPTKTLVMHRTEPTHVQSLCLQLAEKVSTLIENNEKMADMKNGNFFSKQLPNMAGNQQQMRQTEDYQRRVQTQPRDRQRNLRF